MSTSDHHEESLSSVFEERAENLTPHELEAWSTTTTEDQRTIRKLIGPGAKLLVGPRGSGKSTLLKRAYFKMVQDRSSLPIYINYARSMRLEPMFHRQANALQLFRQWVLKKIVVGAKEAFESLETAIPSSLEAMIREAETFIRGLETGESPDSIERRIAPSELLELLDSWRKEVPARRCVLLMDDAAHAFSLEQQRDFFEVFRELRSRTVAGKAAVYPGITSYGPSFHVGHEAERLEVWYRPDSSEFLEAMTSIVERRLPDDLKERLEGKDELVELLAHASFGLPRGFLNMLAQLLGSDETPARKMTLAAVEENGDTVRRVFVALADKIPRFKNFVAVGKDLEAAMIETLSRYNQAQTRDKKAVVVAIREPIDSELERILQFMEYAGLVRSQGTVSRGVKGVFQRFSIHYSLLISANSLGLGGTFGISDLNSVFRQRDAHAFARTMPTTLLGEDYSKRCILDLPQCDRCGAQRISEEQRFCMNCGNELKTASVYEELLKLPLDRLPITKTKIEGIKEHTKIRTIQDILTDDEQALRNVPYVGPIWSARIKNLAEEFVSV